MSKRSIVLVLTIGLATFLSFAIGFWLHGGRKAAELADAGPSVCLQTADDTSSVHHGMVWVEGGRFTMGDTVYPEEGPLREVSVDGFWMDRTEVTNAEFAAFVEATGYVTVAVRPVYERIKPRLRP